MHLQLQFARAFFVTTILISVAAVARREGDAVRDRWLLVWKKGSSLKSLEQLCREAENPKGGRFNGKCHDAYRRLLTAVTGEFSEEDIRKVVRSYKGEIEILERDDQIKISGPDDLDYWGELERRRLLSKQDDVQWGLDIIDQTGTTLDNAYNFNETGQGVHVYVLDTGVRTTHGEFSSPDGEGTRAFPEFSAIDGQDPQDCHGHGSHVAAVVGGNTFGVAKNVTIHGIKVLQCSGKASYFSLLKGLEWLAENHIPPAVAVMSINGRRKEAINRAVENLVRNYHVHVVVASGNFNFEACGTSPASAASAITVGAVDSQLKRYQKSNWGPCVDIHAPGVDILSAGSQSDDHELEKSGTSMACPFVAGVLARYLEINPGASSLELSQKLIESSIKGNIGDDPEEKGTFAPDLNPGILDISSTPNRMLYANLKRQVSLEPGLVRLPADLSPMEIRIRLSSRPTHQVMIKPQIPDAWDNEPLGEIEPNMLRFTFGDYESEKTITVAPRNVSHGHYYINLWLRSEDPAFDGALHSIRILDYRPVAGESILQPRVILRLPFRDAEDSSRFKDTVSAGSEKDESPDVVYSYTPERDMDVDISTCGSDYDTKLIVFTEIDDLTTYLYNDDALSCEENTANSRITTKFKGGMRYFIAVDGYKGAAGQYQFTVDEVK